MDDYYEDKVLADITEKGLKPGDLVGELADPNAPSAAAIAAAELANAQKADRAGGTQGIYRAGGPTTLFGGPGWGPYSDGPLNAVRKSLLNRDGLNEENWMLIAAQRTAEASAEWAKQRRRALVPYGGIFGTAPTTTVVAAAGKDEEEEEEDRDRGRGSGLGGEEDHGKAKGKGKGHGVTQGQQQQEQDGQQEHHHASAQDRRDNDAGARRRKRARREDKVPRGVYEPHSGIVLCEQQFPSVYLSVQTSCSCPLFRSLFFSSGRSGGYAANACSMGGLEGFGGEATSARRYQGRQWRVGPRLGRHCHGSSW